MLEKKDRKHPGELRKTLGQKDKHGNRTAKLHENIVTGLCVRMHINTH